MNGGGVIKFTGAAEKSWVTYTEGGQTKKDLLLKYTADSAGTFALPGATKAQLLVVGGGGGGGGRHRTDGTAKAGGAGGGAGGLVDTNGLFSAGTYTVSVGGGGEAAGNVRNTNLVPGTNGGDTTVATNGVPVLKAFGGGGGGGQSPGNNGGSGGGGAMNTTSAEQDPGVQSSDAKMWGNHGSAGGKGNAANLGGGGGGAGGAGGAGKSAEEGGAGGAGYTSSITGAPVTYAVGGSGGDKSTGTNGATADAPGSGGGGAGKNTATTASDGKPGVVIVRISAAIDKPLAKPQDSQHKADGTTTFVALEENPFYSRSGQYEPVKEAGLYTATATLEPGVTWTDGSSDPVTVTMVVYAKDSKEGDVTVMGVPVSFAGAVTNYWLYNEATKTNDLVLGYDVSSVGSYTLKGSTVAHVLGVGGGGGGGGRHRTDGTAQAGGAGGGAGGLVDTNVIFSAGTYVVSVGAGGPAAGNVRNTNPCPGTNGGDTTIATNGVPVLKAFGGGGGGGQSPGNDGGSGGGGAMDTTSAPQDPGVQSPDAKAWGNLGFAGGAGNAVNLGGGGGGAGGAGKSAEEGGAGGAGYESAITGDPVTYAVGGSGGDKAAGTNGATADTPGSGGGGAGKNTATTASDGKPGIVWVRISAAMDGPFKKPEPTKVIPYDREEHQAIQPSPFYTIGGENTGTTAGVYTAWATLIPGVVWPEGGSEVATNVMTILKREVVFSELCITNWEYLAETRPEPSCKVEPEWVTPNYEWRIKNEELGGEWKPWSELTRDADVGEYLLRVGAPTNGNYAFEYANTNFFITKIRATISDLKLRSWMAGDPTPPAPTCTVTVAEIARRAALSNLKFFWKAVAEGGDSTGDDGWTSWYDEDGHPVPPTEAGHYLLKAEITDKDNFDSDPAYLEFDVLSGLGGVFTDYVEITVGSHVPDLTNFPWLVTLSEKDPVGFLYSRAGADGNAMTFTDNTGTNSLPYVVQDWDTNDVSQVYVRIPVVSNGVQTIRLYWRVRDGASAPAHHPEQVWEEWGSPEDEKWKGAWEGAAKPAQPYSPVSREGYLVNYWVQDLELTKEFWTVEEGKAGQGGAIKEPFPKAAFDDDKVRHYFTNILARIGYDEMPVTNAGSFRVVYCLDDPDEKYLPLETHKDYAVSGSTSWDDLKGNAKSLTLSGRVMLANDELLGGTDPNVKYAVTDQSYWQTRFVDRGDGTVMTNDVFWTHEGESGTGDKKIDQYTTDLRTNSVHQLHYMGADGKTNTLWRFDNIRIGVDGYGYNMNDRYYLPWSETALAISSYASYTNPSMCGKFPEVGNIVMRNIYEGEEDESKWSVVYSPCYTNGIGTIYFDAVNAQYDDLECYRLVVEVARGKDTTDEKADGPNPNGGHVGLGRLGKTRWERCSILPLLHKSTDVAFTKLDETAELELGITGLSEIRKTDNFYRLCVKVNCHEPCRFRIRRTAAVDATTVKPDESHFIILDNILVSYPNMGAELSPFGEYDKDRAGKQILGAAGAMTVPYPAAGQGGVLARAQAETWVNDFVPGVTRESVVIRAQMMYRWRYLDQAFEPARAVAGGGDSTGDRWNLVELWPADGLKARKPLEIPADEGDLEFWFRADVNSPAYEYHDYSGAELYLYGPDGKTPLYVDQQSAVTNRIDLSKYVSRAGEKLPSAGEDWFIRLRAGRSDWEGVRIITDQAGEVKTNEMEVVADGTWRACVETPKDVGKIRYRFEPVNCQTPGATNYAKNVAHWCAKASLEELPNTIAIDKAARADAWAEAPCDAKTGYVMFKLDEQKESVYVARADWQDFNRWVTAVNDKFVGNQTDTNSTTYVAKQIPIDWWSPRVEPSVGTNSNWSEDFSVGPGQVPRIIYPRNVPFDEARSINGWTAHNAMWTYGQYAIETEKAEESSGDATALQLEGRGRGLVEMVSATSIPEGIDTVLYTARVAQFNEFENFTYYNGAFLKPGVTQVEKIDDILMASDFSDVTFATAALLSEKGLSAFSGDGSLSLVANWHQQNGGYEFRVSLGRTTGDLRLELYRWSGESGAMKATCLGTNYVTGASDYLIKNYPDDALATAAPMGGLFITTKTMTDGVIVYAGVRLGTVAQGAAARLLQSANTFATVAYYDTEKAVKKGSVGLLTRNCPGVFENPVLFLSPVAKTPSSKNKIATSPSESGFALSSSSAKNLISVTSDYDTWIMKPGRMERINSTVLLHDGHFGFQAIRDVSQTVLVQATDHGANKWETVLNGEREIKGFKDTVFTNIVRSTKPSDVRIKVLGSVSDPRADVVIGGIEMTQWVGMWTPGWDDASFFGLTNDWVYTSAWVNEYPEGTTTNRTISLQPARATSAASPVSVRSPLMRGFGLFHIAWRNADPHAKALVQVARNATRLTLIDLTDESPASTKWETLATLDFGALGEADEKTIYLNERYPANGALRIVIDGSVVTEALKVTRTNPTYGMVELTDIYAWDLPEYDMHSWIGWNFRAQGWDGTVPGAWANLSDGGAAHGLSGLLNNALEDLADDDDTKYEEKLPHVQSPTFGTNSIGAVDFRARLYGKDDGATYGTNAIVTIYGATALTPMGHEPTGWTKVADFPVSNGVYKTFTQRFKPSEQFYAIRFAVRGMRDYEPASGEPEDEAMTAPMPLRVAIDDICIYERPPLSIHFRKLFVRPFRDAEAMKGVEKVRDIDSVNEQPLLGEAFGFQAEVEVESDEILIDDPTKPLTVDLWYYPRREPWGYENWKDQKDAVHVTLERAVGEKLVFRSTVENGDSMCPPLDLEGDETYKIVQYELVASYWDKSGDYHQDDCQLSAKDWSMPSWNTGFANPNEVPGAKFSGFTLLEAIAPKRAWINEVNFCEADNDVSRGDQWVEIAVPSGIDMAGWQLRLYDLNGDLAGVLMTFGNEGKSMKTSDDPSHYAFYVAKGPKSTLAADAQWQPVTTVMGTVTEGILNYSYPYAFELVRPTGVVEHRAVVQGYNMYADWGLDFAWMYSGTNLVRTLNDLYAVDDWVWAGEDYYTNGTMTVGVTNGYGSVGRDRTPSDWRSPMARTPGARNVGQYIDPNWFVYPNGGYYRILATVLGPHMRQIVAGDTNTFARITVQEGSTTNILYEVDRWYEMGDWSVTPPGGAATMVQTKVENQKTYYTLTLANVTNQMDVTADEKISQKLVDAGLDDKNPYRGAILKWLLENGDAFAGDEIVEGHYRGTDGTGTNVLDLTTLYWLGLDPTRGGWELWGGMGLKSGSTGSEDEFPVIKPVVKANPYDPSLLHTNILTTCWLMITNASDAAFAAYPPNNLQGLANEQSNGYTGNWTSETFKITMQMANGPRTIESNWHTMRQFVFADGSFRGADDPKAPFAARIEITDPFSPQSPAYEWDWWKYADQRISPFTSFRFNGETSPAGVSTLKKDDFLVW